MSLARPVTRFAADYLAFPCGQSAEFSVLGHCDLIKLTFMTSTASLAANIIILSGGYFNAGHIRSIGRHVAYGR